MKKYVFGAIAIVVILLAFAGCQTPVAKVGSDPVTLGLQVTNKGDQAFNCNQTFAVDKKDVTTTVAVGETVNLQSNTHDPSGTVFTCYITPPTSVDQPDPGTVILQ